MKKEKSDLILGSLLHDIGKVVQRARNERTRHSKLGRDYLAQYTNDKQLLDHLAYHHAQELREAKLEASHTAFITYMADNIASGSDRRLDQDVETTNYRNWDQLTNQEDIFNQFMTGKDKRYYHPVMLDDRDDLQFALATNSHFSAGDYAGILERLGKTLAVIDYSSDYLTSVLNLLEATLSYVPSSTNQDEVGDISLYDHMRLTAAYASALYDYLHEQACTDFKTRLLTQGADFYQEEAFLLASFDISGIQDFIYIIRDTNAAKMLRARSFYLEILAENIVDTLLERLELSRANLLYSGGGHAYLLLANTEASRATIREVEAELNAFLQETFDIHLYVAFGFQAFSGHVVMGDELAYQQLYRGVGRMISDKKLSRYSADDLIKLNQAGKKQGRECNTCHRVHKGNGDRCALCDALVEISPALLENYRSDSSKKKFIFVSNQVNDLPLGFGMYLSVTDHAKLPEGSLGRFYAANKFYSGKDQSHHLWIGDYSDKLTFNRYAEDAKGIKRLSVVRCDVDNLGQAFISGFKGRYNTLSRSATFSRNMTLFFKYHINHILRELNAKATVIYAGGDDVFVVGEWYDMLEFAIKLRQDFLEFSQGKLTLSTGVGLYPAKMPIAVMASQTGELEEAAKANDKDSISLFTEAYTFKWDDFIERVWSKKLEEIKQFFSIFDKKDKSFGKAFIYQMLTLLKKSFDEVEKRGVYKTISWAQWVYYLSRMEPKEDEYSQDYRTFASKMHQYFQNEQDARELMVALEIYVYTIRGDENDDTDR